MFIVGDILLTSYSIVRDPRAEAGRALDTKLGQLAGLKVHHAPMMSIVPRIIRGGIGATIVGKPLQSQQVLHRELPDAVNFYVKDAVDARQPSPSVLQHLSIEISAFCRIEDDCLKRLLQDVLQGLDEDYLDDQLAQDDVECGQDLDYEPKLLFDPNSNDPDIFEDAPVANVIASPTSESPEFNGSSEISPQASIPHEVFSDSSSGFNQDSASDDVVPSVGKKPPNKTTLYHEVSSSNFNSIDVERHQASSRASGSHSRLPRAFRAPDRPSDLSPYIRQPVRRPCATSSMARSRQSADDNYTMPSTARRPVYRALTEAEQVKEHKIGLAGEMLTYQLLRDILGSSLPESAWTSQLREEAIGTRWTPSDPMKMYTDFTVVDDEKDSLTHWLQEQKVVKLPLRAPGEERTYHIEVKATASPMMFEPWFMSGMQAKMARGMKGSSANVFLVFRCYGVGVDGEEGDLRIIADPILAKEEGRLGMEAVELKVWEIVRDAE